MSDHGEVTDVSLVPPVDQSPPPVGEALEEDSATMTPAPTEAPSKKSKKDKKDKKDKKSKKSSKKSRKERTSRQEQMQMDDEDQGLGDDADDYMTDAGSGLLPSQAALYEDEAMLPRESQRSASGASQGSGSTSHAVLSNGVSFSKRFHHAQSEKREAMKRQKQFEGTEEHRLRQNLNLQRFIYAMYQAAVQDRDAIQANLTAAPNQQRISRCKADFLDQVLTQLRNKSTLLTLIDLDVLSVIRLWLFPNPDGTLVFEHIRSSLYSILDTLPVTPESLKKSQIGELVMILRRHPNETQANCKLLSQLILRWQRIGLGKSAVTRFDTQDLLQRQDDDMLHRSTAAAVQETLQEQTVYSKFTEAEYSRARRPVPVFAEYYLVPKSTVKSDKP